MTEEDVYVQVLYDFSYINEKGKQIEMKEGEELLVIKKSNQDWWQVIRDSEKCPFYAPLCYLEVITRNTKTQLLKNNSISKDVNANFESSFIDNIECLDVTNTAYCDIIELDSSVKQLQYSVAFQNPLCSDNRDESSHIDHNAENFGLEQSSLIDIEGFVHEDDEEIDAQQKQVTSADKDFPLYANVSNFVNSSPPKPSPNDVPQRCLSNNWSEYVDNNGRKYYYHSVSGKLTWKPPRRSERFSSPENKLRPFIEKSLTVVPKPPPKQLKPKLQKLAHSSTESLNSPMSSCMFTILPPGWVQENDLNTGAVYYYNESSNKKWYSSQDENGRAYFYDEDSSESVWELPDISLSESQDFASAEIRHDSDSSMDTFSSPSVSRSEYLVSVDSSPKLMTKSAPKLPVPRHFKTRSMVVSESICVTDDEKSCSLPCSHGCILIEGTLNKTKLVENGRRVRKNWATSYVVLTDVYLLFYKDQRSAHPISSTKPEFSIDLNGALIDWCPDKSSRKNVFQISTILGHQLLLQHEDFQEIKDWYSAIQDAIIKLPFSLEHGEPEQEDSENGKNDVKLCRSKSTKQCHCSKDNNEDVNVVIPAEKKLKIRDKLRQFFVRRPTIESLREKGIILDEPVFGCFLENLCQREGQAVPRFVIRCIETIEKKEMTADGLYRASGNLSQVQKIRFHVNQDDYKCIDEEEDVHVLTGALKMFFREMKEPLFPFQMFDKFLHAIALPDAQSKMKALKDLVHLMPDCNYQTLKFLLHHLLRVTEFHKQNRMQIQNVAIVFGPTLMWPQEESTNIALDMMYQNRIVEFLLLEFMSIFK